MLTLKAAKFSDILWRKSFPIYQNILEHPFNKELAKGTLNKKRFIFYLKQDAAYLIGFAKALALIAGRSSLSKLIESFLDFATGALIAERELHAKYLKNMELEFAMQSPACFAYVHYLISTAATASLEEAISAILPCFWIYKEVGCHIAEKANENNPYKLWIEAYSSQEFKEGTEKAISILDQMAASASAFCLARMEKAFEISALLEWHFWDDAYKMVKL